MSWFLAALKKYAVFEGRAQRAEYWYFVLFYVLILVGLSFVDGLAGTRKPNGGFGMLSGGFALGTLLPSIAVCVRRLHDTGRSGWWFLISLVPLLGALVLLAFTLRDSEPDSNAYGPNPKRLEVLPHRLSSATKS